MEEVSAGNELVVAGQPDVSHKLICLEFPGVVENEDVAIKKLGGIKTLSKAHYDGQRLEVRFRPSDQYCTPAFSKTTVGSNLVLKVKRRRVVPPTDSALMGVEEEITGETPCDSKVVYEYSADLMGICNKTYQFTGMADYQVLPPGLNSMGVSVDPKDFQMNEPLDMDYCNRDLPSFLPPTCFSKFDRPMDNYAFRPQFKISKQDSNEDVHLQSKAKSRKWNLAYTISFESSGVPKEPNPNAVSFINPNNSLVASIKELYEEMPIWSSAALQWRMKRGVEIQRIRSVLPLIAYNFSSGPFKRLWIKLGCDPRKDPSYKIYQSLDIRATKGIKAHPQSEGSSSLTEQSEGTSDLCEESLEEASFVFFPDKVPTQRQLCYQLRDIRDSEGQELIHRNDGKETVCTEANGWCEENTYDKLRKLLTSKIKILTEK